MLSVIIDSHTTRQPISHLPRDACMAAAWYCAYVVIVTRCHAQFVWMATAALVASYICGSYKEEKTNGYTRHIKKDLEISAAVLFGLGMVVRIYQQNGNGSTRLSLMQPCDQ